MIRLATLLTIIATASAVAPEYFLIGFTHIIPHGLDHILFLLALFFLNQKFADLLLQLTLFTIAHSLTLGLSLYGFFDLPSFWVEIAIALSITFAAAENLFGSRLSRCRPAVVIAAGLVHGLGFAHSFAAKTIAPSDFLTAMFSFNMGIEAGQLIVVAIAYALTALWWKRASYHTTIARPASCIIAISGLLCAAKLII